MARLLSLRWLAVSILLLITDVILIKKYSLISPLNLLSYSISILFSVCLWGAYSLLLVHCSSLIRVLIILITAPIIVFFLLSNVVFYSQFQEYFTAHWIAWLLSSRVGWWDYLSLYIFKEYGGYTLLLLLLWFALWLPKHHKVDSVSKKRALVGLCIILIAILPLLKFLKAEKEHLPLEASLLLAGINYLTSDQKLTGLHQSIRAPVKPPETPTSNLPNIVIIIHESWSKRPLDIFGYECKCMPFLSNWMKSESDHFFKFEKAYTTSTFTELSLPYLWTGSSIQSSKEDLHRAPFIWSFAKQLGYQTILVSSQQYSANNFDLFLGMDKPDVYLTQDHLNYPLVNDAGMDDLKAIHYFNEAIKNKGSSKVLAIFNSNGMHTPYQSRSLMLNEVPQQGSRFKNALYILDKGMEQIYQSLKQKNRLENTLFIITSDHGSGDYSYRKMPRALNFYEEVVNIPLLIKVPANWKSDHPLWIQNLQQNQGRLISHMDILPTLLSVFGYSTEEFERRTKFSLFTPIPEKRVLFATNSNFINQYQHKVKAAFFSDIRVFKHPKTGWNYFNLTKDPLQKNNLWPTLSLEKKKLITEMLQKSKSYYIDLLDKGFSRFK